MARKLARALSASRFELMPYNEAVIRKVTS